MNEQAEGVVIKAGELLASRGKALDFDITGQWQTDFPNLIANMYVTIYPRRCPFLISS